MKLSAIVLAAGQSRRFQSRVTKPLVKIGGKPAIIRCLCVLSAQRKVSEIIVVANRSNKDAIARSIGSYGVKKIKSVVLGGRLRQDSVRKGLRYIDASCDHVLIHDAARPFIDRALLEGLIRQAGVSAAVIPAVPAKATHKQLSRQALVLRTFRRSELWEAQTPQVFRRDLILKAYKRYGRFAVTDDSSLVEKMGVAVKAVKGAYSNIKLTTPDDLLLAEVLAKRKF